MYITSCSGPQSALTFCWIISLSDPDLGTTPNNFRGLYPEIVSVKEDFEGKIRD